MIIGIGTDIVKISRIGNLHDKRGKNFAKRILSALELEKYQQSSVKKHFLAKKWAAKEAVSKALGTGFSQGIIFTDITIDHNTQGQPLVLLTGKAKQHAQLIGIKKWSISISDEKNYAIAFVIAQSIM